MHSRKPRDGGPAFHVKQSGTSAFHVKHVNRSKRYIGGPALLSDAEFLENGPEDVLDVHPAEQPAQGIGGGTQLFGG